MLNDTYITAQNLVTLRKGTFNHLRGLSHIGFVATMKFSNQGLLFTKVCIQGSISTLEGKIRNHLLEPGRILGPPVNNPDMA